MSFILSKSIPGPYNIRPDSFRLTATHFSSLEIPSLLHFLFSNDSLFFISLFSFVALPLLFICFTYIIFFLFSLLFPLLSSLPTLFYISFLELSCFRLISHPVLFFPPHDSLFPFSCSSSVTTLQPPFPLLSYLAPSPYIIMSPLSSLPNILLPIAAF